MIRPLLCGSGSLRFKATGLDSNCLRFLCSLLCFFFFSFIRFLSRYSSAPFYISPLCSVLRGYENQKPKQKNIYIKVWGIVLSVFFFCGTLKSFFASVGIKWKYFLVQRHSHVGAPCCRLLHCCSCWWRVWNDGRFAPWPNTTSAA